MAARKSVSATELTARLEADGDYQRRRREHEAYLATVRLERESKREPFMADLRALGIDRLYDQSTGVLCEDTRLLDLALDHLRRDGYDDETREFLARRFETRRAVAYWDQLAALYLDAQGDLERHGLAASLSTMARTNHVEEMMAFVRDESLGTSRIFFLRPINRLGKARGKEFVTAYLGDDQLGKEATAIQRRASTSQG
jgi:hypothetical protein